MTKPKRNKFRVELKILSGTRSCLRGADSTDDTDTGSSDKCESTAGSSGKCKNDMVKKPNVFLRSRTGAAALLETEPDPHPHQQYRQPTLGHRMYRILLYEKAAHSFEPVHDVTVVVLPSQCFLTNPSVHHSYRVDPIWSFAHEVEAVLVLAPASICSRRTLLRPILRDVSTRQRKGGDMSSELDAWLV